jgi:hypothetical protein
MRNCCACHNLISTGEQYFRVESVLLSDNDIHSMRGEVNEVALQGLNINLNGQSLSDVI